MSLLKKAKLEKQGRINAGFYATKEDLELAWAYMTGKISQAQLLKVVNYNNSSQYCFAVIKRAIREGWVVKTTKGER